MDPKDIEISVSITTTEIISGRKYIKLCPELQ
jgi:hypothetical protein